MLFDPRSHEPLHDTPWSPAAAEAAIREIARDADDALRSPGFWPIHPLDWQAGDPEFFHGIYLGAAGMLWALDNLARAGLHEPGRDHAQLAQDALAGYLAQPELDGPVASMWMGEGGIALVAWLLEPSDALADRLADIVAADLDPDTLELMWGSPGLLAIADAMLARTGDERFESAGNRIAQDLIGRWGAERPNFWTQDLYGEKKEIIGPAHGLAGVVAVLARRHEDELLPRTTAALAATAVRVGDQANWPARAGGPLADGDNPIRTQWCHGAPGIVTSIANLPQDDEIDDLLNAGGELTWAAGPLAKGAGLCHGTAGNGFAFLKLFARTQDERWLDRARRFAMHAAAQVAAARREHDQGRYSLWTGDIGTAIYLRQCLAATADVPTIDAW